MRISVSPAFAACLVLAVLASGAIDADTVEQPLAVLKGATTFVEMRPVFEFFGALVTYADGLITATSGDRSCSLSVGSTDATVDGQAVDLPAAPFLLEGRTMVPLRFVADAMGAEVAYEKTPAGGTGTVNSGGRSLSIAVTPPGGAGPRGNANRADAAWLRAGTHAGQEIVGPDGGTMVWVPPGKFLMGSTGGELHEQPQRKVDLDGYWMHKHEVTVAQYLRFCALTGRVMVQPSDWGWQADHPVVMVFWEEASAYAKWAGLSLPTEAQWEKAARGTDGRTYPWGNSWDAAKCANGVGRSSRSPHPVGSYLAGASPYGCLDMAGNVEEWCADWYQEDYYEFAPSRNPRGPGEKEASVVGMRRFEETKIVWYDGKARVLRGGSWYGMDERDFRCAPRDYCSNPAYRSEYTGFRCASTP